MRIGYLGPVGSYSGLAAEKAFPEAELLPYQSFQSVFQSLKSFETDGIAIPIENSLNGGVLQNMDLLQSADGVYAEREISVKIDHRLAYKTGADLKKLERVYSHAQALNQCSNYLFKNFPTARLISASSTAASLDMVKDDREACIVGAHIKREGVTLSEECISDFKENFTRFLIVKRGSVPERSASRRIYFSVVALNKSGALFKLLQIIYLHGLNMTKIESRPAKTGNEEYRFFIEIEGDYSKDEVKNALADVENSSLSFKLLGAY